MSAPYSASRCASSGRARGSRPASRFRTTSEETQAAPMRPASAPAAVDLPDAGSPHVTTSAGGERRSA